MTFDELYATYADSVYSYLRFKIRDVHLIEDIFQDTFLAVYREMKEGRLPKHPKAWILTITHRRMVDRLRQMPTHETVLQEGITGSNRGGMEWTETVHLTDLLHRLDESARTILYALYVEGLTVREISVMMGIPEGTVKSRSYHAKLKLSQWMKEEGTDGA